MQVESVQKGALRATHVEVLVEEGGHRRGLVGRRAIIHRSDLPAAVKDRAVAVFARLAGAEAKVHGTTPEQVHFHEVGARWTRSWTSWATWPGLHELGVERLYASPVPLGPGWAETAHGRLPAARARHAGTAGRRPRPTRPAPGAGRTGHAHGGGPAGGTGDVRAARDDAVAHRHRRRAGRISPGPTSPGCGWARPEDAGPRTSRRTVVQLETNIDDMNPQLYPAVSDRLFAAGGAGRVAHAGADEEGPAGRGARRAGEAADESALAEVILRETTTLGVRVHPLRRRHEARRELREVRTPFGACASR